MKTDKRSWILNWWFCKSLATLRSGLQEEEKWWSLYLVHFQGLASLETLLVALHNLELGEGRPPHPTFKYGRHLFYSIEYHLFQDPHAERQFNISRVYLYIWVAHFRCSRCKDLWAWFKIILFYSRLSRVRRGIKRGIALCGDPQLNRYNRSWVNRDHIVSFCYLGGRDQCTESRKSHGLFVR